MPGECSQNKKVADWWNQNPFTYNGRLGVGRVPDDQLDLAFFETVERKIRKQGNYQGVNQPLLSYFIDYDSLKGKKVLDIGTGTGALTVELARQGARVTGIDVANYAVNATNQNLKLRNLPAICLKMDAQNMTFENESFDFVSAQGCLMHMPNTKRAVQEIHRVLKPSGKVYAWFYHKGWYYWFNTLLFRGILLGQLPRVKFDTVMLTSRYTDGYHTGGNPHTRFYSGKELREMFRRASFKDPETAVVYNPKELNSWPITKVPLGKVLGKILPESLKRSLCKKVGFGIAITAEK